MEKKDFLKKFFAGLFFVSSIAVTFVVVMVIGIEKGFLQPKLQASVLYHRIDGLALGAPIRLSGVNIGTVGAINFLEEKINGRGVEVTLNIFKNFEPHLKRVSKISIKTEGVLGGKLIEMTSLETGPYLDLSFPVVGEDPIDVQDLYGIFSDSATTFNRTYTMMERMMNEFHMISKSGKKLMDRVEQKVIEGTLFKVF